MWVGLGGSSRKHYFSLGYDVNGTSKAKRGRVILIKVEHLLQKSNVKLTKICDECGEYSFNQTYCTILESRKMSDGKDRCLSCGIKLGRATLMKNVKYEKSSEFYCKQYKLDDLINCFSSKNTIEMSKISSGSTRLYIWNCPIFGQDHEHETSMAAKTKSAQGCPYCSGRRVNHTNCLATTHPNISKLLNDSQDGYKFTAGSAKKLDFKCLDCGYKLKNKQIYVIVQLNGFKCPNCSDGISYPEKFMTNMLFQLNYEFEPQKKFDWNKRKRYDFYIPFINCIIETHGEQHYNRGFEGLGGKSLIEEKDNDRIKKLIAIENGVEKYIIINCSISQMEYIKKNIINSELSVFLDLKNVNWLKCHEFACNTRVKEISEIWSNGIHSTVEISKIVKLHIDTVRNYLRKGRELGWNNYDEHAASLKGGEQSKKVICLNTLEVFESTKGIYDKYKVQRTSVSSMCNNLDKVKYVTVDNKPYCFMFYKEYLERSTGFQDILDRASSEFIKRSHKKIICLNTKEIFDSPKEAGDKLFISSENIKNCLRGITKFAGTHPTTGEKLIWMYFADYNENGKELTLNKLKNMPKRVVQLTKDLIYINEFSSVSHAGKTLNIANEYISQNCQGKRKSSNGYVFLYLDDYIRNKDQNKS